ncbi:hypothetical protein IMG5_014810, partial [Ichthyophthirius multifiliis]
VERATPLADDVLQKELIQLVTNCSSLKQIKKGANESTKALNRGLAELIIMASDATPLEILLHLPLLCEDKNVPYVFVPSKKDLGRACGSSRNVIAIALIKNLNSNQNDKIRKIKDKCERLFINA